MSETFAVMLDARRAELTIETQQDLCSLMERAGLPISKNTMSTWHAETGAPRPSTLEVLLDVLDVAEADRDRWRVAAFRAGERTPPKPKTVPAHEDDEAAPVDAEPHGAV